MRLILASQSASRKKALEILGLTFETKPSQFDEKSIRDLNPSRLAKKLAAKKALEIGKQEKNALIIAGDLFAVHHKKILEKPHDLQEAYSMIRSVSGKALTIIASVAVYNTRTKKMFAAVDTYTVTMRKLTTYEIRDYIARDPVLSFSASLGPNGLIRFADLSHGKYPFQVAFPMKALITFLRKNQVRV